MCVLVKEMFIHLNIIKEKITEYFGDKFIKGNIIYLSLEKMVRQKYHF